MFLKMTEAYNNSVCGFFFNKELLYHVSSLGIGISEILPYKMYKNINICLADMSEKNFFFAFINWMTKVQVFIWAFSS